MMETKPRQKFSALYRELVRKVRQVGILGTLIRITSKLVQGARGFISSAKREKDPFDPKYGTDTSGFVGVGALDIPHGQMEHSMHYGPIWEDEFVRILDSLSIAYDDLVFVDLGSGKGRGLLLASLFPFKRIIGVELSQALHDAAVRNIEIFKDSRQRCMQIEAVHGDASTFQIPNEPTFLFLNNPFDDYVMRQAVFNIEASLKLCPRRVLILYVKPCYRSALDGAKFLEKIRDTGRFVFYESQPAHLL